MSIVVKMSTLVTLQCLLSPTYELLSVSSAGIRDFMDVEFFLFQKYQ